MKNIDFKTLFVSLLSMPYLIVFSYFFWSFSLQYQENHLWLAIKMLAGGVLYFTPYIFFICKNSQDNVFNIEKYSKAGITLFSLILIILSLFMSFYMGLLGKMITLDGLSGLFKYSFLPPLFMIYAIPYFVYTYSKNKVSFHRLINSFLIQH